ncbi:MAG: hypothetical protein JWP34_1027 [Massilia sp.]|nr:hypothetical protein [Massilia sp.]
MDHRRDTGRGGRTHHVLMRRISLNTEPTRADMALLDHIIVRVHKPAKSLRFYQDVLGFAYEGQATPFEVVRVNQYLTLDLMQAAPHDPLHLAFSLSRAAFDAVHDRLMALGIPLRQRPLRSQRRQAGPVYGRARHGRRLGTSTILTNTILKSIATIRRLNPIAAQIPRCRSAPWPPDVANTKAIPIISCMIPRMSDLTSYRSSQNQ